MFHQLVNVLKSNNAFLLKCNLFTWSNNVTQILVIQLLVSICRYCFCCKGEVSNPLADLVEPQCSGKLQEMNLSQEEKCVKCIQ